MATKIIVQRTQNRRRSGTGKWEVRRNGRRVSTHRTAKKAESKGRSLARKARGRAQLELRRSDGTIRDRATYA